MPTPCVQWTIASSIGEEVERRLLAGDDDVDVVPAAQAVVGDREQAVCVRRQVDADDLGLLVHDVVDEARVLVREAVVILPPDVRAQEVVERRQRVPPGNLARDLQPLGVLVEHRVDDVDKRLVAVEEPVAASEEVALEPPLALMLREDLHDAAVGRKELVDREGLGIPGLRRRLEDSVEPVRRGLVGPEDPERVRIELDDIPQIPAEHAGRLAQLHAGLVDVHRVVAEVREPEVAEDPDCVRVRAHPAVAFGRESSKLRRQRPVLVEELLRSVALHPLLEQAQVLRVVAGRGQRHLVRAPGSFDLVAVHLVRARPSLRGPEDDHRPARTRPVALRAGGRLDAGDRVERGVEHRREVPMDSLGVISGNELGLPSVARKEREELVLRNAREHSRVRNLPAVEVQDREHCTVRHRIQELVRMPTRCERAGLGLAVAHDARNDQVGVVERGAEGVRERVPELTALVDRSRRLRRDVARDPAGERELAKETAHAGLVLGDRGVALGVRPLEVGVCDEPRATVSGSGDVQDAQVACSNGAVEVRVDEVQTRRRAEVAQQPRLDMLGRERLTEQRVVEQVHLTDREVVGGAPVRVDQLELSLLKHCLAHARTIGPYRRLARPAGTAWRLPKSSAIARIRVPVQKFTGSKRSGSLSPTRSKRNQIASQNERHRVRLSSSAFTAWKRRAAWGSGGSARPGEAATSKRAPPSRQQALPPPSGAAHRREQG